MKNKALTLVFALFAITLSIITPSQANAGDCSAEDPCGTWAVVDGSGIVTNIIVCQPSVCGSGIFAGNKVVLQVPANPTTHTSQGGYFDIAPIPGEPDRRVAYNTEQKTFTQEGTTWSVPQTNTEVVETITATGVVETTTLTAIINSEGLKTNPATISATQGELSESKTFNESKTSVEFEESIQDSSMLKKYLSKFLQLLRGWLIN
jgi:hypothetical protein